MSLPLIRIGLPLSRLEHSRGYGGGPLGIGWCRAASGLHG